MHPVTEAILKTSHTIESDKIELLRNDEHFGNALEQLDIRVQTAVEKLLRLNKCPCCIKMERLKALLADMESCL